MLATSNAEVTGQRGGNTTARGFTSKTAVITVSLMLLAALLVAVFTVFSQRRDPHYIFDWEEDAAVDITPDCASQLTGGAVETSESCRRTARLVNCTTDRGSIVAWIEEGAQCNATRALTVRTHYTSFVRFSNGVTQDDDGFVDVNMKNSYEIGGINVNEGFTGVSIQNQKPVCAEADIIRRMRSSKRWIDVKRFDGFGNEFCYCITTNAWITAHGDNCVQRTISSINGDGLDYKCVCPRSSTALCGIMIDRQAASVC